jgi:hypothetical protein
MMHGREKSDPAIVAAKPANEAERFAEELVERRVGTEGNAGQQSTRRTQCRVSVSQALERIRQASPSNTQGGSRMRESRTYGSVRGVLSNGHPYRDQCNTTGSGRQRSAGWGWPGWRSHSVNRTPACISPVINRWGGRYNERDHWWSCKERRCARPDVCCIFPVFNSERRQPGVREPSLNPAARVGAVQTAPGPARMRSARSPIALPPDQPHHLSKQ